MFQSLLDFGKKLVAGKFAASLYGAACLYFFMHPSWEVCVFVAVTCAPFLVEVLHTSRATEVHARKRIDVLEEKVSRLVNRIGHQ